MAYGIIRSKDEHGMPMTMAKVIRNAKKAKIINQLRAAIIEHGLVPPSRSTLYKIIQKSFPAAERKLQGGINPFVDEASVAFMKMRESLDKLIEVLPPGPQATSAKELHHSINAAEEYIKHYFVLHLSLDSDIKSHCLSHALSDPECDSLQKECSKLHDKRCQQCDSIQKIFMALQGLVNLAKQYELGDLVGEEIQYDLDRAQEKVYALKCHLMRAHVQNLQFDQWFHSRDTETVFVTIDWAMKVSLVFTVNLGISCHL